MRAYNGMFTGIIDGMGSFTKKKLQGKISWEL